MESFFERVAGVWPAGQRDLHWHVLPTAVEADALLASYQTVFAQSGLSSVPIAWLHCTLLHAVGASAEDVDVDALVTDVRTYAQQVDPFTITFDRPAIGPVAIEISGWPGAPFSGLVNGLTHLMQEWCGSTFRPAASRYPHMSVAYTNDGSDSINAVDLKALLANVDGPLSHTVRANRIHLVEQWHDGSTITWNPITSIPLETA